MKLKKWKKLVELTANSFSRGTLIKFPAEYPFEKEVIMMISESPDGKGLCLITITGYKAGINCYQKFPELDIQVEIKATWLLDNWNKWVWPEGDVNDVWIHDTLQANDL